MPGASIRPPSCEAPHSRLGVPYDQQTSSSCLLPAGRKIGRYTGLLTVVQAMRELAPSVFHEVAHALATATAPALSDQRAATVR